MGDALIKGWLTPALFLWLAGCASIPEAARELPGAPVVIELADTPFFSQQRYQCGPAALTTLLVASGAEVTLDELVDKVYLPGREGSLQLEMIAATRTSGRLPYLLDGSLAALLAELEAGRPVVVLQNLGVAAIPRWHYAVVIGIDAQRNRVILRSGTEPRRETRIDVFLRTWARSNFWALVALRPGDLPGIVDRRRYLASVAAFERAATPVAVALAWQAALERWPSDATALFGLGNARLALADHARAERSYRELLELQPGLAVARNNLALALAGQRRFAEAIAEIDRALADNDDTNLVPEFEDTRARILALTE